MLLGNLTVLLIFELQTDVLSHSNGWKCTYEIMKTKNVFGKCLKCIILSGKILLISKYRFFSFLIQIP